MSNPICRGTARPPPKTSLAQNNQTGTLNQRQAIQRNCENYQQHDNMAAHGPNCKCPICGGGKKPPKTSYGPSSTAGGRMMRSNCEALENQNGCERSQEIDQVFFGPGVIGGIIGSIGKGITTAITGGISSILGATTHGENNGCETDQAASGYSGYQPGYEAYRENAPTRGATTCGLKTEAVHGTHGITCRRYNCPICSPGDWGEQP